MLAPAEHELLVPVWPNGRNPKIDWDGGHFALPGHTERPISVSRVEARLLANLVTLLDCHNVVEIGTGFGYSTAWLACGLASCSDPGLVFTIDDLSQGALDGLGIRTARELWGRTGVNAFIRFSQGTSPGAFDAADIPTVDLAFIDGEHYGEQPLRDYGAVVRRLSPHGCIVFHDAQDKYTVDLAITAARRDGLQDCALGTSCEMAVVSASNHGLSAAVLALSLARRGIVIGSGYV